LERLENDSLRDYVKARPLAPGVGLAGNLWLEEDESYNAHRLAADPSLSELHWRSLQPIADDPDQAPDPRLPVFLKAGIGLAAGVPFNVRGFRGIVIYFARSGTHPKTLMGEHSYNALFLRSSADHIGAVCALAEPMRKVVVTKKTCLYKTLRRIVIKLEIALAFKQSATIGALKRTTSEQKNSTLPKDNRPSISRAQSSRWKHKPFKTIQTKMKDRILSGCVCVKSAIVQRSTMLAKKARATSVAPPPSLPVPETAFVFIGSFLSLLLIQAFVLLISEYCGYTFKILSPLGALMASQYVLTAAPASQPRNTLYGNAIGGITSLIITMIPTSVLPKIIRVALATSAAVALQAKLGVIHPPGIGFAITLASGKHTWIDVPILLGGSVLAILSGTFILNINEKRQYPIYWAFGNLPSALEAKIYRQRSSIQSTRTRNFHDDSDSDSDSLPSFCENGPPTIPQDSAAIDKDKKTQNGDSTDRTADSQTSLGTEQV